MSLQAEKRTDEKSEREISQQEEQRKIISTSSSRLTGHINMSRSLRMGKLWGRLHVELHTEPRCCCCCTFLPPCYSSSAPDNLGRSGSGVFQGGSKENPSCARLCPPNQKMT
ncbi:Hypothetical predicted protein [Xyrichtys novacula]|uniref:Uncharacterized protein n=1 Tax=Xyrichtys novacula TaxID=13765 RepID=A0AAV1H1Q3_XYRNO|nr:Hypothetical predicted protein [Xyrichtys novacula]